MFVSNWMDFVDVLQLYAIPWFLTMYAREYFLLLLYNLLLYQ